jgi:hypothetical protein
VRKGQPAVNNPQHLVPQHPAVLAVPRHGAMPETDQPEPKQAERRAVHRSTVVAVVSLKHQAQPFAHSGTGSCICVLSHLGYRPVDYSVPEEPEGFDWIAPKSLGTRFSIGLYEARDNSGRDRGAGLNHIAFTAPTREAVEDLYQVLLEIGANILDPPCEYPKYEPGYYAVFFFDPDGSSSSTSLVLTLSQFSRLKAATFVVLQGIGEYDFITPT